MSTPIYCNVDEVKDRLCLTGTDRDNALLDCCTAATRWIEERLGRRFYTVTETRLYTPKYPWPGYGWAWNYERPSGGVWTEQYVCIDDFMSITQVATDENGDGVFETIWTANTDYWLAPINAALNGQPYRKIYRTLPTGGHVFPAWPNSVSVTGACGAATDTPATIRELALIVAELYARPLLDLSLPGVEQYKIGTNLSVKMADDDLPERAKAIIANYSTPVGALI